MKFVNRVADIAEAEGHHPDIHIHYNRVRFDIWTHAIDGLSENDFILAAKIDSVSS
jgi:4a-hydroxytetrahydrobiopterin dehydratase